MLASNVKYYVGILLIIIVDSLHKLYFNNNDRFDVYLFYDHSRYFTNILYDISNLFKITVLTYFLSRFNKNVFEPFFILSLLGWVSYFIFYNQYGGIILVPSYLVLVLFYNRKKWIDK